ncbi:hypothetical protein H6P81_003671 [Aristolochia fimbriata]|uniref:Uncharacterized protein n=1 Tax=Aristolochia fimbriata TaxID=158543 RepID=A0AAV7FE38_ARIFI|nr:hypothetical protein H6P81_003671 [Aristolochia fimbriata]
MQNSQRKCAGARSTSRRKNQIDIREKEDKDSFPLHFISMGFYDCTVCIALVNKNQQLHWIPGGFHHKYQSFTIKIKENLQDSKNRSNLHGVPGTDSPEDQSVHTSNLRIISYQAQLQIPVNPNRPPS